MTAVLSLGLTNRLKPKEVSQVWKQCYHSEDVKFLNTLLIVQFAEMCHWNWIVFFRKRHCLIWGIKQVYWFKELNFHLIRNNKVCKYQHLFNTIHEAHYTDLLVIPHLNSGDEEFKNIYGKTLKVS